MKHLDLFSGYGGFTISAKKIGWDTIGFSEIDKYADKVLKFNFPNIKNYGDITKIKGEDLPSVDIITGGSPCQDLSVAGKGAGLDGTRSGLFFHFIRLINEKKPTYFIWENVKGALSSSKGWDFARVQIEMEQIGYDVQWQVINAKDFGVPQNRERIFAIGTRKGSGREILFEQRESGKDISKIVNTGHDGTNIFDPEGTGVTLKANGGGQGAKTGLYAIPNSKGNVHSLDANYWKGSNNPNKSRRSQIAERVPLRFLTRNQKNIEGDYAYTVDSSNTGGIREGMRIRRLTPTECERLMGLEDGWTKYGSEVIQEVDITGKYKYLRRGDSEISDTQRYKMCGNGVVVNCVDYIFSLI